MEVENMEELKLRRLHRGYLFTDFDGNEVGCKDSKQAMEEIEKLLQSCEKSEEQILGEPVVGRRWRRTKQNTVELHRKIFENAKDQISLTGKVNGAKIARDLDISTSTVSINLGKMSNELEALIKKWQDERDGKMVNADTRTNIDGDNHTG